MQAFHRLLTMQYPKYVHPRLATTYYGVFDVDENSTGQLEGEHLVAGASITIERWDLLDTERAEVEVTLEHIIVESDLRCEGIGTALMCAIVEMYCDREIQLAISSRDDVDRLTRFYRKFEFSHAFGDPPRDKIMSRPKDDNTVEGPEETAYWCYSLRAEAANRRDRNTRAGIDLSRFKRPQ